VKKRFIALFATSLFLFSNQATAQRGWEAGGGIGVSHYFGDLNTSFNVMHPGIAVSGTARFNFNDRICLKMSATYGTIGADDKDAKNVFERQRNLNFSSAIVDGAAQLEFNFLPYNYFDDNQRFTPYLFAGFNVFTFNPTAKYNGQSYSLRTLGTEGQFKGEEYYTTQMGLVYGGGLKIALDETWSINIEASARALFTDYLDDVSTVYPKMTDLNKQRGPVAVALSDPSIKNEEGQTYSLLGRQRGEKNNNDMYTFFTVSLLYYFGDLKCPSFGSHR
jgi:opacity protein-like surface antigen